MFFYVIYVHVFINFYQSTGPYVQYIIYPLWKHSLRFREKEPVGIISAFTPTEIHSFTTGNFSQHSLRYNKKKSLEELLLPLCKSHAFCRIIYLKIEYSMYRTQALT